MLGPSIWFGRTDIANMSKVYDYYMSELPKHGWNITDHIESNVSDIIAATKGPNTVGITVGPEKDTTKCVIQINITPTD